MSRYSFFSLAGPLLAVLLSLTACKPAATEASSAPAEPSWPEITREAKPWSRWWWPASAVTASDIDTMLSDYARAGLGGMEVTTIYGAKGWEDKYLDYLSDEWMDLFCHTLDKAASLDLGIDLANASGWPFGGPWVDPEDACRYLASKVYDLKGGGRIEEKIEYVEAPMLRSLGLKTDFSNLSYPIAANDSLQQYAFEQVRYPRPLPLIAVTANSSDGTFLELTDRVGADGMLDWTAPEGDWTVCALFLGWHGKLVERAGPGGEGDVIDHFSGEAITRYLSRFDEAFKGRDVSGIRYYFNDSYEVDDARGNSDWTPAFFEEFKARRGYDLKPHMYELLGRGGDAEAADRVVFDFRTTRGELLLEKYSMTWQQWAAAQGKGIRNQAHGSPANILDLYAVSDVPETEGNSVIGMKTASSAAHVTDKPLTSSESATWLGEHFVSTLGDVKTSVDRYFLAGVNHIFYHGTCMSPDDAPWPGWLFYAAVHFQPTNPFWADFAAFNDYVARCQSFLQSGLPDSDILLFFDATDLLSERGGNLLYHMSQTTAERSSIGRYAIQLYNAGYKWDYVTDRMIQDNLSVKGGRISTRGGTSYKALVVPECRMMLPETFDRLLALAKGGATILVQGDLPGDVPGLGRLEQRRRAFEKARKQLKFKEEGGLKVARCGRGRFIVSDDLDAMVAAAGITRERLFDLGLASISRVKPDGGRYYFVKNNSNDVFDGWLPLDAVAGSVAVFNPMTAAAGYGEIRTASDGTVELRARLLPDESLLLETFAGVAESPVAYTFMKPEPTQKAVTGSWSLRFTDGGPVLPRPRSISSTGSWTLYGKEYEDFSGTAEYKIHLQPTYPDGRNWQLDLGDVRESAAVWLDGEYLGTVFKKPYAVTLTADQVSKGGELTVRVSSSMENRIRYMDRAGIPWRIFYNANIQARLPQDRGEDGFFTARGWEVQPSGLLGPVVLRPLSPVGPLQ